MYLLLLKSLKIWLLIKYVLKTKYMKFKFQKLNWITKNFLVIIFLTNYLVKPGNYN